MTTHGTWFKDDKTGEKVAGMNPRSETPPKKAKPKAKEK